MTASGFSALQKKKDSYSAAARNLPKNIPQTLSRCSLIGHFALSTPTAESRHDQARKILLYMTAKNY